MSGSLGLEVGGLNEPRASLQSEIQAVVGRNPETQLIERNLNRVIAGRGALLLIGGEPGIGKSTLAHVAEQRVLARGLSVAWGRFREDRTAPALWPWLQVLHTLGHDSEEAIRERVGAAAEDLWPMMSLSEPGMSMGEGNAELSVSRRFRLFEATANLLRWGDKPVCVLLDDIHRADAASLDLLRHVAEVIDLQPTFILATYRDNEVHDDHRVGKLLQSVASRPSCTALTLGPLSREECHAHATSMGHELALDSGVVDEVIDRSGGNPFFLEELLRSVSAGEPATSLPQTVREVILQRADLLGEQTRSTLEALSVLGRDFDIDEAEYLLDSEESIIDLLEPAMRSRLLYQDGIRFRFRHALVRDALYEALPLDRRRAHHERLAGKPLTETASVGELTDRAHHSSAAADLGARVDVVGPALAAARAASAGVGHAEAVKWFQRALEDAPGAEVVPITLELAEAQLRSGDIPSARSTFEDAFRRAEKTDAAAQMAMATLGVGRCVVTAGPPDTDLVAMLEKAEERLVGDDPALLSRLLARRGVELYWKDGDAARELTAQALGLIDGCTSPRVRAEAMHARMFCLRGPGRLSERVALGSDLVDLAVSEDLVDDEFRGRVWLIPELLQVPDLAGYRANIAALGELAERTGHPLHYWYAYLYRAQQAIAFGALDAAADLATAALEQGRRAGAKVAPVYHIGQQYLIRRDRGDLESILDELTDLSARFEVFPTLRALLSLLHTDIGRSDEAAAELTRLAYQRFSAVPHDSLWIATLCICAEVSFRTRTPASGALIASLLEPHAGTCAVQGLPTCFGAVDRYLGLALAAAGRLDRSRPHLQRAVQLHRQWGFVPFELRSELDLIRVDTFDAGDPSHTKKHLARLAAVTNRAQELGLARLADEASALAHVVGQIEPVRPSGPGGELSSRESEILALIAEGVTNRELAEKLTISINTVERHLHNIYTKLGVANRAEAAAVHVRHTGT